MPSSTSFATSAGAGAIPSTVTVNVTGLAPAVVSTGVPVTVTVPGLSAVIAYSELAMYSPSSGAPSACFHSPATSRSMLMTPSSLYDQVMPGSVMLQPCSSFLPANERPSAARSPVFTVTESGAVTPTSGFAYSYETSRESLIALPVSASTSGSVTVNAVVPAAYGVKPMSPAAV